MRDMGDTNTGRRRGTRRAALTCGDVVALRRIKGHAADADRSGPAGEAAYREGLAALEAALTPAARACWFDWPSSRLAAELARWRPAYLIERTRSGLRAFRWVASRGRYASRPTAAGLDASEAAAYGRLVRT